MPLRASGVGAAAAGLAVVVLVVGEVGGAGLMVVGGDAGDGVTGTIVVVVVGSSILRHVEQPADQLPPPTVLLSPRNRYRSWSL